jgi:uncharacterized membrane protein YgaE (UPF0421/DUF939 family)
MADESWLTSVGAIIAGRRGPLRALFSWLRRVGLGERIVKTAVAATLAWEVGRLVPDNPQPYLAPLTAILVMQPTIAQSISYAVQRALGVGIGIAVATLATATVGVHGWSIGLVVLVSLAAGARLRLGPVGTQQVAVSALLVLVLGATGNETAYALRRVADTIVGTLVGLGMNSFFAPPSRLPQAQAAVRSLGERISAVLDGLATGLADGITRRQAEETLSAARSLVEPIGRAQSAFVQATESLRYNPARVQERTRLTVDTRARAALEHAAIQTRVIARTLAEATDPENGTPAWLAPDGLGRPFAALMEAEAALLRAFLALIAATGDLDAFTLRVATARQRLAAADRSVRAVMTTAVADHWTAAGELLAVSGRLLADLETAARDVSP